jgi:hypothetical protein
MLFCSCAASARRLRPSFCGISPATLLAVVLGFVSESCETRQCPGSYLLIDVISNVQYSLACLVPPPATIKSVYGRSRRVSVIRCLMNQMWSRKAETKAERLLTRSKGRPWNSEDRLGGGGASSIDTSAEDDAPESRFVMRPGAILSKGL